MDNYKQKLKEKIDSLMKQYNISENDVSFGDSGQIKGVVLGLKMAYDMIKENEYKDTNEIKEDNIEPITRRSSSNRRSRTSH